MTTNTAAKPSREPVDSVAMLLEGHLWCYMDEHALFFRLKPGTVPAEYLSRPDADTVRFLARARAEAKGKPPVPVERGDTSTIGGAPIDRDLLQMIEGPSGALLWRPWRRWLAGFDEVGDLAALWKMPDGVALLDVSMVEVGGHIWAANSNFFVRFTPPEEALEKIRPTMNQDATVRDRIAETLRHGAAGKVVTVTRVESYAVKVGDSFVPREQFDGVLALLRVAGLEWRWTGPVDPVVGFIAGEAVAAICPFQPATDSAPQVPS